LKLAHNTGAILANAARRHMEMDASVEIAGGCRVGLLVPPLFVRIDSHIVVRPVFLKVIEQEWGESGGGLGVSCDGGGRSVPRRSKGSRSGCGQRRQVWGR
jgi:hypothetical protein